MIYEIQSHIATIGGYIKQGAYISDTKECAILNSMGFSLTRYDITDGDLDFKYIYNLQEVKVNEISWDRKTGVLKLKLTPTKITYNKPINQIQRISS